MDERTFSQPEPEAAWLLVAVTGLCELAKAARDLHDHDQARAFFGVAEGIANAVDLPQLREMVRSESSSLEAPTGIEPVYTALQAAA